MECLSVKGKLSHEMMDINEGFLGFFFTFAILSKIPPESIFLCFYRYKLHTRNSLLYSIDFGGFRIFWRLFHFHHSRVVAHFHQPQRNLEPSCMHSNSPPPTLGSWFQSSVFRDVCLLWLTCGTLSGHLVELEELGPGSSNVSATYVKSGGSPVCPPSPYLPIGDHSNS